MPRLRNTLVILGVTAALMIPFADAFARGGGGRGGGGGGGGRGGGGGGGGRGQVQAPQENPQITADRQQVTTFTTALNSANQAYAADVAKFTATYQKQPDFAAAKKAVDDDTKAVEAARVAVIAKLKASSTDYKAAVAKETDAQKQLDKINAAGGNRDQRATAAQAKLDAGDVTSKLEKTAQDTDPAYSDAKKKLTDAVAVLQDLKDKLAQAIKDDPALAALKTKVDEAQTSLTDARKKLSTDVATLPPG